MKKIFQTIVFLLLSYSMYAQAKKPTIMVVPSRQWCIQRGYYNTFDNYGMLEKTPDYQKAFDENDEIALVISKINTLFVDRGFPLKDLKQSLSSIRQSSAEDAAMSLDRQSAGKGILAESLFDKIRNIAKADIIIEIQWTVTKTGPQQYVTFLMDGKDAYSDKQIAGAQGTGQPSISSILPVMLEEAVLRHIDNFNSRLTEYFDDLFTNGREIRVELRRDAAWDKTFETEFNGEELSTLLQDWFSKNTVKGRFSTDEATENKLVFSQVRIPLYNANQTAIDARAFGTGIQKLLKAMPYQIETKVVQKGLGSVQIICGRK